jgi:single-stranded DNA-binding protein
MEFRAIGKVAFTKVNESGKMATISVSEYAGKDEDGSAKYDVIQCKVLGEDRVNFLTQYFPDGNAIDVYGDIKNNNYTSKDGVKVFAMDFIVNKIKFVPQAQTQTQQTTKSASVGNASNVSDDDLPF